MKELNQNQVVDKMVLDAVLRRKCFIGKRYTEKINEAREGNKMGKYFFWIKVANYQKKVKDLYIKLYRLTALHTLYNFELTPSIIKEINDIKDDLNQFRKKFVASFDTRKSNTLSTSITEKKASMLAELVKCEGLAQMMYFNLVTLRQGKDYISNARKFNIEIEEKSGQDEMTDLMLYDRFCNFYDYVGTEFVKYDNHENKTYGHIYSTFDLVDEVSKEFGAISLKDTGRLLATRAKSVSGEKEKLVLKFLSIKPLLDALFRGRKEYLKLGQESRNGMGVASVEPFAVITADGKEYVDVFKSDLLQRRIKLTGIEKPGFANHDIYSAIKSFINNFKDVKFDNEYFDSQLKVYLKNAVTLCDELKKDKDLMTASAKQMFEERKMILPKNFGEDNTNYNDI